MFKKLVLFITVFLISITSTYGNNIYKDSTYFSYMKLLINSESELLENDKGKGYIDLINTYLETAGKSNLSKLYYKLELIDENELKDGLNKNIITYLKYKTFITIDYIEKENEGYDDLILYIISDKKNTDGTVDLVRAQLDTITSIQNAEIVEYDFSDDGIEEYLEYFGINRLPLFMFSTNNFDISDDVVTYDYYGNALAALNNYLYLLPNNDYYLNVGSSYNPFIDRSDRGFLYLSQEDFNEILEDSYFDGDINSKFLWIEYSDLECPYCAKFHSDNTQSTVIDEYEGEISIIFNHFPLSFHSNAATGAEILECLAEQKGSTAFYDLLNISFDSAISDDGGIDTSSSSGKDFLIEEAYKLGADKEKIETCLSEGKYTDKVNTQMNNGANFFSITGTPGSVIINTETLEYEVIAGAYPASTFIELIERLK